MGWGYCLEARKNHNTDHEERMELIYWHKFEDLFHAIRGFIRYEPSDPLSEDDDGTGEVVLEKNQLKKILEELIYLEDYWSDHAGDTIVPGVNCTNGFSTVTKLCEIIAQYDLITDNGWEIVFYMT